MTYKLHVHVHSVIMLISGYMYMYMYGMLKKAPNDTSLPILGVTIWPCHVIPINAMLAHIMSLFFLLVLTCTFSAQPRYWFARTRVYIRAGPLFGLYLKKINPTCS